MTMHMRPLTLACICRLPLHAMRWASTLKLSHGIALLMLCSAVSRTRPPSLDTTWRYTCKSWIQTIQPHGTSSATRWLLHHTATAMRTLSSEPLRQQGYSMDKRSLTGLANYEITGSSAQKKRKPPTSDSMSRSHTTTKHTTGRQKCLPKGETNDTKTTRARPTQHHCGGRQPISRSVVDCSHCAGSFQLRRNK